jgi:hypothetical protein
MAISTDSHMHTHLDGRHRLRQVARSNCSMRLPSYRILADFLIRQIRMAV